MSYILDALKESQQSREGRQVPDLQTVHEAADESDARPGRKKFGLYLSAILVLTVFAAGIGWWYGGQMPSEKALTRNESAAPVIAPEEVRPVVPAVSESITMQKPEPAGEPSMESLSEPSSQQPQTVVPEPPATRIAADTEVAEQPVAEVEVAAPSVEQEKEQEQAAEAVAVDTEEASATLPPQEQEEAITQQPQTTDIAAAEPSELPAPAEPQEVIPHFRELPYDIQQRLPKIQYSVHLYSPTPQGRLVKIDGLVRREGDQISPGVVLLEITPRGAVFVFRNYKFRVPVN